MFIKVTFEFETADAAIAFLEGADASPESADKMTAKTRGRPKKDTAASPAAPAASTAAVVSVAPAATQTANPTAGAVAGPGVVPFKDVADAVTKLADIDTPRAKQVLATFGVTLASQLKPEQYGAVVKAFTEAMAPAPTSLI